MGSAARAHPSFGMTPTQAIWDLFAWRCPFDFIYQEWIPNVAGKQAAYHAMAEYHQAMVAQEKKEFGEEIARLQVLIEIQ